MHPISMLNMLPGAAHAFTRAWCAVNNCLQYSAYYGVSTNLVNYLKVQLHSGSKAAANSVTNWQGTASITPLAAGFLADSFLGRYWTITLFLFISVAGYG
uniref:Major facilitator superfamily (MFS) profile domain-containing protein n=1 Tax=Aegilops tauschii subsp. strangulata TaxID=200361 RepID=A0A453G3D5_AEGTS